MAEGMPPVALLVGLGNPGAEYRDTRHNAGFWWAEEVARRHGGAWRRESKFHGELCRVQLQGTEYWLLKPATFMNHSGQAVAAIAGFYKIPPEAILVAHDDLDLPPGTVRLKRGGGHGGHNGLRDMAARLGSNGFLRVRLGIGHPGHRDLVTPYVLNRPSREDRECIERAVVAAAEALPQILEGRLDHAMQRLHTRS